MNTPRLLPLKLATALLLASADFIGAAEFSTRPPAPSLTRPASPAAIPDADGFIRRWLILEPIRSNTGLQDDAVKEAVRERGVVSKPAHRASAGRRPDQGRGREPSWHALESKEYNVNLYHFAYALGKPTSFVLFWVLALVECPEETRDVRLAIGSNAASVWWVDGQEVASDPGTDRPSSMMASPADSRFAREPTSSVERSSTGVAPRISALVSSMPQGNRSRATVS